MNIRGEKVQLRDRWPSDWAFDTIWGQDEEIQALDVATGKITDKVELSIATLNGEYIGVCSLYDFTLSDAQLGIRIGNKNYWNKGYGTDAVNLLVGYAFTVLNLGRVWLKVIPTNPRAIRCYEKAGFLCYGQLALGGYSFITMERGR